MEEDRITRLLWHGPETVKKVRALLDQSARIEIELPTNYNHVLFRTLHPNALQAELETMDTLAGPELLAYVATISGLEELAALTEALSEAQATVQIVSPPKVIITLPSVNRAD